MVNTICTFDPPGAPSMEPALPHLYAPEAGFDPAAVALKFTRQLRRRSARMLPGWSVGDYCDVTAAAFILAADASSVVEQ